GFYAGRPKIDTLNVLFIQTPAAAIASLLAGSLDGAIPNTLDFDSALSAKAQWEQQGKQPLVVSQSNHWRTSALQFRPELVEPRDLLDVRVRRALLEAIDRQALVDALYSGAAPVSDDFLPPNDYRSAWVKDVVTSYPYDPRQAQALLTDAGWQRTSDGGWLTSSGRPALISDWSTAAFERDDEIIANDWRAIGIGVDQTVLG